MMGKKKETSDILCSIHCVVSFFFNSLARGEIYSFGGLYHRLECDMDAVILGCRME